MPTVHRVGNLRVVIYPNDHRPAHVHVHVIGNGCEAVFNLHCPSGPPEVRENHGFSQTELTRIQALLANNIPALCLEWKKIHDSY